MTGLDRSNSPDPALDSRSTYEYQSSDVSRPALVDDLTERVDGDVRFDTYTRQLYATDASAYEVTPIGVVFPRSTKDVAATMEYCAEREIPVLPRGGGTSLAGQAVNEAVVLDFTRYMTDIVEIDPDAALARVQPGTVLSTLNEALEPHNLKFAPDPSTADRSAIGGAIGNNTTGAHSLIYGKTDAYVEELEVVFADGSVVTLGEMTLETLRSRSDPDGNLEARFYAEALRIIDEERDAVREAYPSIERNVSGYNLDVLVEQADAIDAGERETVNLAKLIVGSEGTLAIVTEAVVSLEPRPETKAIGLLTYDGLINAMEDVKFILEHEPAAVEVIDDVLLSLARSLDEFADDLAMLPERTESFLLVEFYADDDSIARERVRNLLDDRIGEIAFDGFEAFDPDEQERFWKMRKASTPILMSPTTDEKHIAFVEDIAVPPEHLPEYIADFQAVFDEHDTFASFYAHAGPGCIHVRPLVNTRDEDDLEKMVSIADAASDLAVKYGGSVSGEHGDGRTRTQWNRKLYGDHLWGVFRSLKSAVDPAWLLNPGSVCGDFDMTEHLRFEPGYSFDAGFEPALNWDIDNGFRGMAELCHGCGGCRGEQSTTGGVMCPTYRASTEEIQSTRGRANLLRQAMTGDLPEDAQFDPEFMNEVLSVCIGCKGCSIDCPSEVDMAKMKVEMKHAYHDRHGPSVRERLFANIDRVLGVGSALAPVSNWLPKLPGSGYLLEKTLGIARERSPPRFHRQTFVDWFDERGGSAVPIDEASRRAIVYPDSFTNYNHPDTGKAAVAVLEAAGVHVDVPSLPAGSGRPPYSEGFVDLARSDARSTVETFVPRIEDGWDLVVLEPSDAVMMQSDYFDLLSGDDLTTLAGNTYGLMEYLDRHELDAQLDLETSEEHLIYHGHCHQKATKSDHHAVAVLRRAGYRVDALDSGCCGMAGSFGYEAEHYSMSQAIGRILFDQIDASEGETVVAPGGSCRMQIGGEYGDTIAHPIQKLAAGLP